MKLTAEIIELYGTYNSLNVRDMGFIFCMQKLLIFLSHYCSKDLAMWHVISCTVMLLAIMSICIDVIWWTGVWI